eukprot:CAMPEP_0168416090 /NCGR_PEP_ID=MMETSP0228-20121227/30566_1 /TAXON_ID=133427 /ORGANISM="Protoceratium reticulatum, Strain CCCM 535 (=CCMP 1889)" /LENGTH=248 /DNA_ID=CAMNT_0008429915 /DNA_START=195 /DNA_END=938 /DNA_ORIENTATION=+
MASVCALLAPDNLVCLVPEEQNLEHQGHVQCSGHQVSQQGDEVVHRGQGRDDADDVATQAQAPGDDGLVARVPLPEVQQDLRHAGHGPQEALHEAQQGQERARQKPAGQGPAGGQDPQSAQGPGPGRQRAGQGPEEQDLHAALRADQGHLAPGLEGVPHQEVVRAQAEAGEELGRQACLAHALHRPCAQDGDYLWHLDEETTEEHRIVQQIHHKGGHLRRQHARRTCHAASKRQGAARTGSRDLIQQL